MVDFNNIQTKATNIAQEMLDDFVKPWADIFGFEYDKSNFEPIEPKSCLPESKEGVYRTETDKIYSKPKPNPYKGMKDEKIVLEFADPIWPNAIKAKLFNSSKLSLGQINRYPPYIYSTLKVVYTCKSDDSFTEALTELDAIITRQDMNFINEKLFPDNITCPFYLSFLKTRVIILVLEDISLVNITAQKPQNRTVKDLGLYCPYYDRNFYDHHPTIMLFSNAIRAYAKNEQKDLKEVYMRTLLKLFAYAYQDPTNTIDETGAFVKKEWNPSFSYDEQEANEFVKKYLP